MKTAYKIPDLETCRRYLPDAEKIDRLPEEDIETIDADFDEDTLQTLQEIARLWDVTIERVMQALLIALVRENEDE